MADRKYRYAVISRFEKLVRDKGMSLATINKNAEQWSADALLDSYGLDYLYGLMEYYVKVSKHPTWKYFSYNADKIDAAKRARELDDAQRAENRKRVRKWLNES